MQSAVLGALGGWHSRRVTVMGDVHLPQCPIARCGWTPSNRQLRLSRASAAATLRRTRNPKEVGPPVREPVATFCLSKSVLLRFSTGGPPTQVRRGRSSAPVDRLTLSGQVLQRRAARAGFCCGRKLARYSARVRTMEEVMKKLGLAGLASTLLSSGALSMPLMTHPAPVDHSPLVTEVRVVCNESGVCIHPPGRRPIVRWIYGDGAFYGPYDGPRYYGAYPGRHYKWSFFSPWDW
jgi:hypothetical protein